MPSRTLANSHQPTRKVQCMCFNPADLLFPPLQLVCSLSLYHSPLSFSLSLFLAVPLPQNANFHIPILPFPKLLVYFQMLLNPQLPIPSPASTPTIFIPLPRR